MLFRSSLFIHLTIFIIVLVLAGAVVDAQFSILLPGGRPYIVESLLGGTQTRSVRIIVRSSSSKIFTTSLQTDRDVFPGACYSDKNTSHEPFGWEKFKHNVMRPASVSVNLGQITINLYPEFGFGLSTPEHVSCTIPSKYILGAVQNASRTFSFQIVPATRSSLGLYQSIDTYTPSYVPTPLPDFNKVPASSQLYEALFDQQGFYFWAVLTNGAWARQNVSKIQVTCTSNGNPTKNCFDGIFNASTDAQYLPNTPNALYVSFSSDKWKEAMNCSKITLPTDYVTITMSLPGNGVGFEASGITVETPLSARKFFVMAAGDNRTTTTAAPPPPTLSASGSALTRSEFQVVSRSSVLTLRIPSDNNVAFNESLAKSSWRADDGSTLLQLLNPLAGLGVTGCSPRVVLDFRAKAVTAFYPPCPQFAFYTYVNDGIAKDVILPSNFFNSNVSATLLGSSREFILSFTKGGYPTLRIQPFLNANVTYLNDTSFRIPPPSSSASTDPEDDAVFRTDVPVLNVNQRDVISGSVKYRVLLSGSDNFITSKVSNSMACPIKIGQSSTREFFRCKSLVVRPKSLEVSFEPLQVPFVFAVNETVKIFNVTFPGSVFQSGVGPRTFTNFFSIYVHVSPEVTTATPSTTTTTTTTTGLATSTTTASPTPSTTNSSSNNNNNAPNNNDQTGFDHDGGVSDMKRIGVPVIVSVVVLAILGLLFFLHRRRQQQQRSALGDGEVEGAENGDAGSLTAQMMADAVRDGQQHQQGGGRGGSGGDGNYYEPTAVTMTEQLFEAAERDVENNNNNSNNNNEGGVERKSALDPNVLLESVDRLSELKGGEEEEEGDNIDFDVEEEEEGSNKRKKKKGGGGGGGGDGERTAKVEMPLQAISPSTI